MAKIFSIFSNEVLSTKIKAIHYYTLANEPVGPEQFKRAVRISTGQGEVKNCFSFFESKDFRPLK